MPGLTYGTKSQSYVCNGIRAFEGEWLAARPIGVLASLDITPRVFAVQCHGST